jgi:uncharacterized protein DUF4388
MLSGSLDEFALSDVFSLLSATKKTGTLHLRTPVSEGWLEFRDGDVAYAVSDTRRMALASRLLGGGLLDDAQLRHVVAAQRGGASALSAVLLDQGILDEAAFDAMIREQIQDAVFELMRQPEGTFSFEVDAPGEPVRVTLSTDELVAEGDARLRRWDEIVGHILSFDAVVTLAPQPPPDSVRVSLDAKRWRLLTLVDGRRTVRELVQLTGQGEYGTCQVLAGLVEAGLVQVVDPAAGKRTGVAELLARHEMLHRLEERELRDGPVRERSTTSEAVLVTPTETEPEPVADEQPERSQESVPASDVFELPEPQPQEADPDRDDEVVVGYREDEPQPRPEHDIVPDDDTDETFDRDEIERELAALGYGRDSELDTEDEDEPVSPYRIDRSEDANRGLLNRLIDIRKQP